MESALTVENLVKEYRSKTRAVNNISFNVEKGEFFGFLGPNGAGKSTTIHCITGIAKVTSGTIKLFNVDVVKEYREARKRVGLSPQEFNIDIFTRVDKLLGYVAGYYGIHKNKRNKRIKELLEQFELGEHSKKSFRELSGGLKRRVLLARAMVHDPDLLILDEPTAGVDVELRHELWKHLQDLNKLGKTIILTSHYLEEVEMLCSRVAIINKGIIVANEKKEVFNKDGKSLERRYLEVTKGETY
jgi:ABC-2 type transport system ATP-binding protein